MSVKVSLAQIWSVPRTELEKILTMSGQNFTENDSISKLRVEVAKVYLKAGNLPEVDSLFASDPRFYHILLADDFQEGMETLSPPAVEEKKNPNKELIDHFNKLASLYRAVNDTYRASTFELAASEISKLPFVVTSSSQVPKVKGLGPSTYTEITDFLKNPITPRLRGLQPDTEKLETLKLFEGVFGIGPETAQQFYNAGYRRIEDLPNLTEAQRIGVKYYYHLKERIPRSEMVEFDVLFTSLLPKDLVWLIAGSYRRCRKTSGDIDLIFKSNDPNRLREIVELLMSSGVITDKLAFGPNKFMGICVLPGDNRIYRRIDVRIFNDQQWPYGLLYNTGSGEFNRQMRIRANQFGLSLNEYELANIQTRQLYTVTSERGIFELLNMTYLLPRDREI